MAAVELICPLAVMAPSATDIATLPAARAAPTNKHIRHRRLLHRIARMNAAIGPSVMEYPVAPPPGWQGVIEAG